MEVLRHWSVRHARGLKRVYDACAWVAPLLARPVSVIGASRVERLVKPVERAAKSLFFDCQMCGHCALSLTGMACPMNCPKSVRNGPCGGVRPGGMCEVEPAMRCVWVEATEGRKRTNSRVPAAGQMLEPIDQRQRDSSTWMQVIAGKVHNVAVLPETDPAPRHAGEKYSFEQACESGRFLVTAEIAPPDSPDPHLLLERAGLFAPLVDAINITDGAGGNCHMSSAAAAAVLTAHGHTAVCQIGCRDRNRIAVQGDILGAAALGIRNFLCLTGDDVSQGDHPQAKRVFDLDAVSLLHVARGMRDHGQFASGRKLDVAPDLFLGATANPFVAPFTDRIVNLEQKIEAGAQFIQTQFCFDLKLMDDFMREVRRRELHRRAKIIVGVGTLSSAKALRWMAEHVPGVHVPASVLERIGRVADQKAEGRTVLVETIRALRDMEGVVGVHVMGHKNERTLAEAIVESGVRRQEDESAA